MLNSLLKDVCVGRQNRRRLQAPAQACHLPAALWRRTPRVQTSLRACRPKYGPGPSALLLLLHMHALVA